MVIVAGMIVDGREGRTCPRKHLSKRIYLLVETSVTDTFYTKVKCYKFTLNNNK